MAVGCSCLLLTIADRCHSERSEESPRVGITRAEGDSSSQTPRNDAVEAGLVNGRAEAQGMNSRDAGDYLGENKGVRGSGGGLALAQWRWR